MSARVFKFIASVVSKLLKCILLLFLVWLLANPLFGITFNGFYACISRAYNFRIGK